MRQLVKLLYTLDSARYDAVARCTKWMSESSIFSIIRQNLTFQFMALLSFSIPTLKLILAAGLLAVSQCGPAVDIGQEQVAGGELRGVIQHLTFKSVTCSITS